MENGITQAKAWALFPSSFVPPSLRYGATLLSAGAP